MADTADLVVLGAFYGQGSKGQDGLWPLGWYFFERPLPRSSLPLPGLVGLAAVAPSPHHVACPPSQVA